VSIIEMGDSMRFGWLLRFVFGLLIPVLFLGAALLSPDTAEAKSARYERFDIDLEVLPDGTFAVTETQVVNFSGGQFTRGHRSIPTHRTEGTDDIRVAEIVDGTEVAYSQVPLDSLASGVRQYSVVEMSDEVLIYWTFEPTYDGERTFVVRYNVLGALRVYPNEATPNQQVWRTMVGSELTAETPVEASRMTVTLPQAVDPGDVILESDGDDPDIVAQHTSDGRVFTWDKQGFKSGEAFTVRLQFPPIIEGVTAPSWQAEDDAQRAREERSESRNAVIHVMMLAAGLLLIAGGSTGVYGVWYARGRDPHTGIVADFVPSPPDDLPPGVAGTLVDERANECDIVATLLDLAHRGEIAMTDLGLLGPTKRASGHDYLLELTKVEREHAPHEVRMLKAVFGPRLELGTKRRLSEVTGAVVSSYPAFREELYQELVRRGFFTHSPESTRKNWGRAGLTISAVGVVGGVLGALVFDAFALIPGLGLAMLGLVVWRMSKAMPRKTAAGAEAAAKWKAFKRYLDQIERYENLKESREIFDIYLPYAVAFGVDESWVAKFARVQTPIPTWFDTGDLSMPRPRSGWDGGTWVHTGSGGGSGGGIDLPDIDLPDLQKSSNRAGGAMQSGSSGLMDLLKVAGAILEIASSFSGGGSRGGSSGGGGGGFS
jgi:hypothetical protein